MKEHFGRLSSKIIENKKYVLVNLNSLLALFSNLAILVFSTKYLVETFNGNSYGIWIFLLNVTNYISLAHLGYTSTLTAKYHNFKNDSTTRNQFLTSYFLLIIVLGILGYTVGYLVISNSLEIDNIKQIKISNPTLATQLILVAFLLNFISLFIEILLYVYYNKLNYRSLIEFIKGGGTSSLYCIGIYFFTADITILAFIYLSVSTAILISNIFLFKKNTRFKFSFAVESIYTLANYWSSSLTYLVLSVANIFINQFDSFYILNILKRPELIVIYSQSYRINDFSSKFIRKFAENKAPKIMQLYEHKKFEEIFSLTKKIVKLSFFSALGISVVILLFGKNILELWLKNIDFEQNIFTIFSLLLIINSIYWTYWYIYNIIEFQHKLVWVSLLEVTINISLSIILIGKYQLVGLAMASLIANTISLLILYFYIKLPKF